MAGKQQMQSLIMTSLQGNKSQHELELIQFIHKDVLEELEKWTS